MKGKTDAEQDNGDDIWDFHGIRWLRLETMTYGISAVDVFDMLEFSSSQQSDELILRTHREYRLQGNETHTENSL